MKKISVVIIGAGMRGTIYATEMKKLSEQFEVVAVAESSKTRRNKIKEMFNLSEDRCYCSWEEILEKPKMADVAVIATLDDMHYQPALKAIELGYDLLLEKPVAQTAQECVDIALAAKNKGAKVLVCHVLRYTAFFGKIKQLIMDGTIGDIMSVVHVEAVGNVHQSHSYVRGNWHNEETATPMLLAKCCHDIDIIQWLLDKPCKKVSSFGDLTYFKSENAPKDAPKSCVKGNCPVRETCPYDCIKLYYDDKDNDWFRGALAGRSSKSELPNDEEVMTALENTDYGLCVFHANNDVVDHQVVNMEFDGGVTANLTMNAFNEGGRYIRLFGTKGELYANMSDTEITVYTFEDKKTQNIQVPPIEESIVGGHGGGDAGIIQELYEYMNGDYTGFRAADISVSVKNHLIGFASEKARRTDSVIKIDGYFEKYGISND